MEEQKLHEFKELPDKQPEPAPANRISTMNETRAEITKNQEAHAVHRSQTRAMTLLTVCRSIEAHCHDFQDSF